MRRFFTELLGIGLFLVPIAAVAADSAAKSGRLPDGRAFRIDSQGMRLIDHLAELEVNNSDLQRQVEALENELRQNRTRIKDLQLGKCGSTFKESSLGSAAREETIPRGASPREAVLEAELRSTKAELQGKAGLISELEQKNSELSAALTSARNDSATPRQQVAAAPQTRKPEAAAPVSYSPPPPLAEERAMLASASSGSSDTRTTQVALKKSLAEIDKLILKRKDLIDSLKSSKKGVSVQIQPLVSPAGDSLDTLRMKVSNLSANDSARVESGIANIRALLHEDIRVMERLKQL